MTVRVDAGTIPATETRTFTFEVIVDDPVAADVTQISNQGTVTADGPITVLTDDPVQLPGTNDPTVTPLVQSYDVSLTQTDNGDVLMRSGGAGGV